MSGQKINDIILEFRSIIRAKSTPELTKLQLERAIKLLSEIQTPEKPKKVNTRDLINKRATELVRRKKLRLEDKFEKRIAEKEAELEKKYERKNKELRKLLTAKRSQIKYYKHKIVNMVGAAA